MGVSIRDVKGDFVTLDSHKKIISKAINEEVDSFFLYCFERFKELGVTILEDKNPVKYKHILSDISKHPNFSPFDEVIFYWFRTAAEGYTEQELPFQSIRDTPASRLQDVLWDHLIISNGDIPHWVSEDYNKLENNTSPTKMRYFLRFLENEWLDKESASFSYPGYNEFREILSQAFLGVTPRTVWNNFDDYVEYDIALLINGSDCEGVICKEVTQRIANSICSEKSRELYSSFVHRKYPESTATYYEDRFNELRTVFESAKKYGKSILFS